MSVACVSTPHRRDLRGQKKVQSPSHHVAVLSAFHLRRPSREHKQVDSGGEDAGEKINVIFAMRINFQQKVPRRHGCDFHRMGSPLAVRPAGVGGGRVSPSCFCEDRFCRNRFHDGFKVKQPPQVSLQVLENLFGKKAQKTWIFTQIAPPSVKRGPKGREGESSTSQGGMRAVNKPLCLASSPSGVLAAELGPARATRWSSDLASAWGAPPSPGQVGPEALLYEGQVHKGKGKRK